MKWISIILAFSILTQAHKICVPGSCQVEKETSALTTCSADDSGKKSCCHTSDNQQSEDHSCDGESCHCLCCIKVFITSPTLSFFMKEWIESPEKKDEIRAEKIHDFEFSDEFYHPPKILTS